jgi:DNA-binding transcriptional MerR regulator
MQAAGKDQGDTQLKVGELARRAGLTVRTLHHYDDIGLLKPSGRSEAGYRLYGTADVARLHGIQALRQLGLPLGEIAAVLGGEGARPQAVVQRQLAALDAQIAQAGALRARLALLQEVLRQGGTPDAEDWLDTLSLMATFGKYFDAGELQAIFDGWRGVEPEWHALLADVRAAMDAGLPPQDPRVQPLMRRWLAVVYRALDGDLALMSRWDEMYRREPQALGRKGAPPPDMMDYVRRGTGLRLEALRRHLSEEELARCRPPPESHWRELQEDAERLMRQGHPAGGAGARALVHRWLALLDELAGHDPALRAKLARAAEAEPLLRAGAPLSSEVQRWLAASLDPHAA